MTLERRRRGLAHEERGEERREKGEGRREKGEGRREKGEGRREGPAPPLPSRDWEQCSESQRQVRPRVEEDSADTQGAMMTVDLPLSGASWQDCQGRISKHGQNDAEGLLRGQRERRQAGRSEDDGQVVAHERGADQRGSLVHHSARADRNSNGWLSRLGASLCTSLVQGELGRINSCSSELSERAVPSGESELSARR